MADDFDWEDSDVLANLSDERLTELGRAWLRYQAKRPTEPDDDDPDWWAVEVVMDLSGDIDVEWRLILSLCSLADPDDEPVEMIGAGPIESMMFRHGESVMDLIEPAADSNPTLLRALASVWAFDTPSRPRLKAFLAARGIS